VAWFSRAPSLNQLNLAEHAKDKKSGMSQSGHSTHWHRLADCPLCDEKPTFKDLDFGAAPGGTAPKKTGPLFSGGGRTGAPILRYGDKTRDVWSLMHRDGSFHQKGFWLSDWQFLDLRCLKLPF
jgi:hypothetical protein